MPMQCEMNINETYTVDVLCSLHVLNTSMDYIWNLQKLRRLRRRSALRAVSTPSDRRATQGNGSLLGVIKTNGSY